MELQLNKNFCVMKKGRKKCKQFAPPVALAVVLLGVALPQSSLSLTALQI